MNIKTAIYTLLLFITSSSGFAQLQNSPHIKQYTTDNGLPHNIGFDVIQDSKNYIWLGTDDGLVRFNGKHFKTYRSADGLLSNYIINLTESQDGKLWIGSWKGGLNYLYNDSIFTPKIDLPLFRVSYVGIQGDKLWLSNRRSILYPYTYSNNELKFNHHKKAVFLYQTKDSFPRYDHSMPPSEYSKLGYVRKLDYTQAYIASNKAMLLFGSLPGVWQYHNDTIFTRFYPDIIKNDTVYDISQDINQTYWVSCKGKILKIDTAKNVEVIQRGLPNQNITNVEVTSSGKIYFITNYINLNNRGFYSYDPTTATSVDLKTKLGLKVLPVAVKVDHEDNVWLITNGEGVYCMLSHPFTNYDKQDGLTNIFVNTINEDKEGNIYVGTINGVFVYKNNVFSRKYLVGKNASEEVNSIIKDQNQSLLISILQNIKKGSQNHLFKKTTTQLKKLNNYTLGNNPYLDSQNKIWTFQDNNLAFCDYSKANSFYISGYKLGKEIMIHQVLEYQGKHWLVTNKGLFALEYTILSNNSLKVTLTDTLNIADGLSSNFINQVAIGKKGALWIGTKEGICKWYNGKVECFDASDGLVSNNCNQVLVDHNGIVWVGTSKGLSRFDGKQFINYNHKNGLIASDINCLFLSNKKQLWIGTSKGVSRLNLSKPFKQVAPPKLYIENIQVNGIDQSLNAPFQVNYHSHLKLYFSALTYTYNEGVRYQYRLNGGKWQETSQAFVEYNTLTKGTYLFEVRAKKFNSAWSTPTKIVFEVIPPFWDTWWFKVLVGVGFVILVYGIVKWRSQQLIKDKLKLEQVVVQRTFELAQQKEEIASQAEKLKEMDQIKSHFFSNVSHELRTPLTLIIGPAEQILHSTENATTQSHSKSILNNAQRLLKLINQLLDFSKLESGKLILQLKTGKFHVFLKNIIHSFELLANQKNIGLKLLLHQEEIMGEFDHDKLEKVFFNLLSNALKFTPENGWVTIEVKQKEEMVQIKVSDTGIGIPPQSLPFIFDRFYQVDGSQTRTHEGTGIGLSLVKELVELHGGNIKASSEVDKGTTFFIQLPIVCHSSQAMAPTKETALTLTDPVDINTQEEQTTPSLPVQASHTILVVEDNHELRQFIRTELTVTYQVIEAADGVEGIEKATSQLPDLIISDLMMPKADGLELLRTLRNNPQTCHIPIIILSAKASFESKITGLETGGDDYLTKPFSPRELVLRIKNTLERREKLKEAFMQHMTKPELVVEPSQVTATSMDEVFLTKALDTVEEHLNNTGFDVSAFSKEMGMSQSGLFKKLKAITNLSTTEFIRTIRLKRAASLIKQKSGRIEEIAFQVGFNDISYFNRCFKKQFGVTPKKYQ
ncbi:ATP-binding protein [uncultured Microscilla sp.]|uniref:hybrid sensor histidine kinase/response regulator transcription factor n=1 Tax=uncultured Microscilla sp. TaxID=432653 RepID=UPI0026067216|nr:ATP-binding protein [uncultured Microscilla sp.]